jgi:hypothetical protein
MLSRSSDTFPSKTRLFCKTFQGRDTETLGGFLVQAFDNLFERPWLFGDLLSCKVLFFWGELGWSATTRFIIEALSLDIFPFLDPCRYRVSINLIDCSDFFDLQSLCTEQKTLGTHPGSGDGIMCHDFY